MSIKIFILFNLFMVVFIINQLKVYGQDITSQKIRNVSQILCIWEALSKKYHDSDPLVRDSDAKTSSYFMNYIRNNMTEEERDAVLKDAYSCSFDDNGIELVINYFIIYYTEKNNEAKIIEILSKKCPQIINLEPIESYLARLSKFKYPLKLLFDAYEKSNDELNKKVIIAAITSAFINFDIKGKGKIIRSNVYPRPRNEKFIQGGDPSLFMKNANTWYNNNRDKIIVDDRYSYNSINLSSDGKVYLYKYKAPLVPGMK